MKIMKNKWLTTGIICCSGLFVACTEAVGENVKLKDLFAGKFLIGAAVNSGQTEGLDSLGVKVIQKHFNAIVPENCMKSEVIQPEEGRFDFTQADSFVRFGETNKLFITGHTLVWHSQAAAWFFTDKQGKDVSREVLIERMKNHITTIVSRYKGRVKGWDVVNEAIMDDGSWRKSKFYQIIGEDYIPLAFRFAHEADPDAELYYNDYSMAHEGKRQTVVRLVKSLQAQGIRIDAVGMQGHLNMEFPKVEEFEKSIVAFSETGVNVMVTELDLSVLPVPGSLAGADISASFEYQKEMNPYPGGLPERVAEAWSERYLDFFKLFLKHSDKISRVTLWGVSDAHSWRNDWPIPGRKDYPLLFDRNYQPKEIINRVHQNIRL